MQKYILILVVFIFLIICVFPRNIERFYNHEICGRSNLNRIALWKNVKNKYGIKIADWIFPRSYLLPDDISVLQQDKNKHFILKRKWASLRNGVDLYDNKNDIVKNHHKYDIAQVFIKKPYLINGFKFDIRIFMAVDCNLGVYVYKKGYNVYTKKPYKYDTLDRECKINMAYAPDNHYDINRLPRTTDELQLPDKVWYILGKKLGYILGACDRLCCSGDRGYGNVYGMDVELLENMEPKIIEINSTPSMNFTEKWKIDFLAKMKQDIRRKNFTSNDWMQIQ